MSGLEALGAAAAVAQMAQYGIQFAERVVEVYKNSEGTSERLQELQHMSENLHRFTDDFTRNVNRSLPGRSEAEVSLRRIAQACQEEATSLLALAERLKIQGTTNVLKSVRLAFKLDRNQSEIRKHSHRLEELRKELHGQLLKIIYAGQANLEERLTRISQRNEDMEDRLLREFVACKDQLIAAISHPKGKEELIVQLLADVRREWEQALKRQALLDSLQFPTMQSRYDGIGDASNSTYEWVLSSDPVQDNEEVNIASWFQRDSGIYWVTGKAGSGKSTLMKFIGQQQRTRDLLNVWAGDRSLFVTSFYFWNAGDSLQKSQEGLLQSILYNILLQCPELNDQIRASLPKDFAIASHELRSPWTLSTLRHCVDLISNQAILGGVNEVCFCFFIDGLDEYYGDHEELVRLIIAMDRSRSVKLCVSSRPWEVFRDAFKSSRASRHWLQLHLHTRGDIAAVAHQELDHLVQDRQEDRGEIGLLVHDLVEKAEGVFLWVTLVIKELIKGFRHADDLRSLRRRLDRIPPGLDKYFGRILGSIDPFYETESARILLCCLLADLGSLPVQAFNYIAQGRPGDVPSQYQASTDSTRYSAFVLEQPRQLVNRQCLDLLQARPVSLWNSSLELEQMRKRLNGRCLDLLQVLQASSPRPFYTVQFLHRTVQEFLENADVTAVLKQRAGPEFDDSKVLCHTLVLLLRATTVNDTSDIWSVWKTRWAGQVFMYAQALEFEDGITMSRSLEAVCEDLHMSFSPHSSWFDQVAGQFLYHPNRSNYNVLSSDNIPDFNSASITLLVLIQLGLVQNAKEYLRDKGAADLDANSTICGIYLAFTMLRKLLSHDGKSYASLLVHSSALQPLRAIEHTSVESLRQHFADAEFFKLLVKRARAQLSTGERNYIRQNLWIQYWNLVLNDFSVPDGFSEQSHKKLRQSLRDITALFAQTALDLTGSMDTTDLMTPMESNTLKSTYSVTTARLEDRLSELFGDEEARKIIQQHRSFKLADHSPGRNPEIKSWYKFW